MGNIIEREFGIKYRGILAEITNFPDIQNRINKTGLNSNQQKILNDIFDYIKNPGLDSPAIRANDIFTTLTSPVPDVDEVNDLLKQIQDIGVSIKKEQDLKKAQSAQPPAPNPVGSTSTPVKQPVIPTQPIQAPPPIIVRPKTPPLTQPPQSTVTPPATPTTIDELSKQEQYYQKLLATYKASETPDFKMEREILAVKVQLTKIQKRKIKIQIQDLEQSAVPDKNSQIKLLKEKLDFLKTDHMIATIKLALLTDKSIKMKDPKTAKRTFDDLEIVIQEVRDRIKYYQILQDRMSPIISAVVLNNPEELAKQQKVAAIITELSGLQLKLIEKFKMQSTSTTHASHDPASQANSKGQDKKPATLSATISASPKDSDSKHPIPGSTFTATVSGDPKSSQRSGPKTDDASNQAKTSRDAATLAAQQALIDKGILNKDYIYYLQQNADKDVKNKTQSGDEVTFGGLEKRINDNERRLEKLKNIKAGKRLAAALEYANKDEQKLDAKVEIYNNAKVEKESDDKLTVTLNNPKDSTKSSNSYTVVKDDKDLTMTTKDPLSSISDEMIVQMIETAKRTVGNQTIVISNLFHDKQSPAEKDDAERIAQKIEGYSSAMGMKCKIEDNGLREKQDVRQTNRSSRRL